MKDKEKMIFKGKAIEEIREAWKNTCKKFGLEYDEDDWNIVIKDKEEKPKL